MISFSKGYPNPSLLPTKAIAAATSRLAEYLAKPPPPVATGENGFVTQADALGAGSAVEDAAVAHASLAYRSVLPTMMSRRRRRRRRSPSPSPTPLRP